METTTNGFIFELTNNNLIDQKYFCFIIVCNKNSPNPMAMKVLCI